MVDLQRFSLVISFMQSTDSGNKGNNDKTEAWLEADPSKKNCNQIKASFYFRQVNSIFKVESTQTLLLYERGAL